MGKILRRRPKVLHRKPNRNQIPIPSLPPASFQQGRSLFWNPPVVQPARGEKSCSDLTNNYTSVVNYYHCQKNNNSK